MVDMHTKGRHTKDRQAADLGRWRIHMVSIPQRESPRLKNHIVRHIKAVFGPQPDRYMLLQMDGYMHNR